LLGAVFSL